VEFWLDFLPIIIYILLIIFLIIGIILGIRFLFILDKVDKVVEDVNDKVKTLNGFFHVIDYTTDKIALVTDKAVEGVTSFFTRLISGNKNKNKKKIEKEDD